MGDLLIRNVSNAVKADIERLACKSGKSLSDTAQEVLRAGVEAISKQAPENEPPPGQKLRELFSGVFETNAEFDEFQKIMEEVRHAPGRPAPDFE